MDLISRKAAIDVLRDEYHGMISDESMKIYQIINFLDELPPAQQWIPVSERLPEEDGNYLVFGRCVPDENYYCFISNFDTGCEAFGEWVDRYDSVSLGYVDSDFYEQDCILAWRPLPEPYKAEVE